MPVLNINMHEVTNKKMKGMRPHMIYQNTFYKGLRRASHLKNDNEARKRCVTSSKGVVALLGVVASSSTVAEAQTLRMMKSLDAPHYDGQRTTWSPTSDIVNMFQDTLVAMDWDGKTAIPYLAKSWTVSPDGKLYTFKLRDDVSFCSGKKFTADDVVYSFKRLTSAELKAPLAWRAGNLKDIRATDPYTVEYELNEPFSDLLLNLTMFTTAIHNKESVESLGKDYGVKAIDGTGPWCFDSWQPRTEIVLKRHDAYKWGPSMYQNKGPVKFEKLSIKIVPEDSSRVAAMMGGQFDVTHQIPLQFIQQVKAAPNLNVQEATAQLPAHVLRLQDDAADGGRQARARGDEHRHQPRRDRQGHHAGQRRARPTPSSIPRRSTSPIRPRASSRRTSSGPRSCSTRPAGRSAATASARRTA